MTDISDHPTVSGSIPTAPGALPLLGHLPQLLRLPLKFLASLPAYGDLVVVRLGTTKTVVVCEPGLVRQVLRDDQIFDKGGFFVDKAREFMGEGLATVPRLQHRPLRHLCQPAFHASRMPGYEQVMTARTVSVIDEWHDGQVLDVCAETEAITSSTLVATALSDTLTPTMRRQATDDLTIVLTGLYRRMMTPPSLNWLPTPGNRRYHRATARLHRTLADKVADRRSSPIDHGDLLSALLAARDTGDSGRGLSDTEITDQINTFFLAGTEAAGNALAWALGLLAQHPEVEQRLHVEVDTVLAGRPAEHADLPRLALTGRIITETLRLWPPAWLSTRRVTADTRLGGYSVPKDTTVVYSPYLIHRRPDLFDCPDRFDPDRWLPECVIPKNAYIPFGGGARTCIGHNFAFAEAVLALATIASRWRLQPLPGHRLNLNAKPAATLAPRGLRLSTARRTPAAPATGGPA